ncbi:NUDIX domain-containing protein [Saccharothrix longispora]|uniref:NUDIX domain-containing protein n=1 Tax=Saccharothrix longispora TaxID=33920 RepID=UPI0028FD9D8C|nr:NUDIX domain-containing protein [Saccharothrix longispora]MDU0294356.1 NUDIX domain-containing protein [Saccharothrix longispora]
MTDLPNPADVPDPVDVLNPVVHRHLVDVHVKLVRGDGRVLLIRRRDPDARFDGKWHLPAGKVEAGESAPAAAVREVAEEVGVRIWDVKIFHITHAVAPGVEGRVGIFLEAGGWEGEPVVREPDRCSGIGWFALSDLPDDLLGYTAIGLSADEPFSVVGWERGT